MLLNRSAEAAVGINKQISFQGKVVAKADGTNVTDGSYSFTFRIYASSSGDTGSPCASTCIWEETKSLTVTSGIFQTNLGDTTALPGSVDFNSDTLYLSVKFNGDTEMSPRIRLSAVPYAFNADKLGGLSSSGYAQLSPGSQQTGSLNISGDMNIGSGSSFKINGTAVCSGTTCTAASGSGFYIQKGTSTQTGNFNIQSSSSSSIAAVIQGAASQSVDIFEVKDSGNSVLAKVDSSGNFTISKLLTGQLGATISGAAVSLNSSSNFNTSINTGTSTGSISIGNASSALSIQGNGATAGTAVIAARVSGDASNRFSILADGTINWGPGTTGGDVNLSRSSSNTLSTNGSFIASGLLTGQLGATISGAAILLNASSNFNTSINTGSSTGSVSIGNASSALSIQGNGATAGTVIAATRVSGDTSNRFTILADGTMNWGPGSSGGDVNLYRTGVNAIRTDNNFIAGTHLWTGSGSGNLTSTLGVTSSVSSQVAEIIQGVSSQTADLLQLQDSGSNILLRVSSSGVVGTADTSTAATNTAATTLRTGNSTTSGNTGALAISTGNAANGNSGNITIGAGTASGTAGGVIIKNGTNSNSAFQIQSASSFALLTADATNTRIDLKGGLSTAPLGSTLLTNGDFATNSCSSWTCGAGWAAGTGAAVHTTGNTAALSQTVSVTNNTTYQIDFTTSGATAGGLTLAIGANTDGWQYWDINTHRTIVAPSTGSLTFSVTPTTDFNGTLDNFTVKAITGSALAVERQLNSDGTAGVEVRSGGSGLQNTYIGINAGQYSTTAVGNAVLGNNAFQGNTSGSWNAVLGQNALFSNTTGSWNVSIGQGALYANTVGTSNIAIGQNASYSNVNGNTNTVIGASAGYMNTSGYGNVFIGATAGYNETGNNKLYIANSSTSTPLIGGDFSTQLLTVNGSATFKPTSGNDSTTAFQIQNSSSASLFTVDSTNKKVIIGSASSTPTLLILANKNDNTTDPTGTVGAMYYNSTLGKMRCYQGSKWSNCTGTPYYPDRHWGMAVATALNGAAVTGINNSGVFGAISEFGNTKASDSQTEDNYGKYTSSTTNGAQAGTNSTYAQVEEVYRPYLRTRVRTGPDITNQRIIVRFGSNYLSADSPAEVWAGFRYSTTASDTTWKCGAGDGTTSSFDNTGVTVSANHYYDLTVDWTTSGQIICGVSDNGGSFVYTTHTGNVVTNDTSNLYYFNLLINLSAASHVYEVAYGYLERN